MSPSNSSVLWSFLSTLLVISNASKCPPPEMIRPCQCSLVDDGYVYGEDEPFPSVVCFMIRSIPALRYAIAASLDHPFTLLKLYMNYLSYIPASALKKGVRHLRFEDSVFVDLFDQVPEENHKLQTIDGQNSKILRGMDWKFFKNIRNLTKIFLYRVPIKKLDKDFLENVQPSLDKLTLHTCNIYRLDDRVFSGLTKIKGIDITGGRLTTLKRSMFPKENVISFLSFDSHKISSLPDDIFDDMPQLETVFLNNNPFKTLSETIFGNFKERGIHLTFYETEVICNCDLRWTLQRGKWELGGKCGSPDSLKDKEILEIGDELEYCDIVQLSSTLGTDGYIGSSETS